jgi:hypothetical protein
MSAPLALLRQIRLDLFNLHDAKTNDLKALISSQRYTFITGTGEMCLRPYSSDELISAISGDCSKFIRAACETLAGLSTETKAPKNSAWFIIRCYYAAFYAAHALLRVFGYTCSNIDGQELNKLREVAMFSGKPAPSKGFYRIEISADHQSLDFYKLKNSHEDTWASVLKLINTLRDNSASIAAPKHTREQSIQILSEIRNAITNDGKNNNGAYLSFFRNQVQYRFAAKAWYPYGSKDFPLNIAVEDISKSVLENRFQKLQGNSEIVTYLNNALIFTQFVLSLVDYVTNEREDVSFHLKRDYKRIRKMCA